jgi:leucyl/phenylalanyl-tRNA--protein transferase
MFERSTPVMPIWLEEDSTPSAFPPVALALEEPNGLLAVGGDLSPSRLVYAYRHGIFPWYSFGQPILWWSPAPRAVVFPQQLNISRRLKRSLRQQPFEISVNKAFAEIMQACAMPRPQQPETWISREMQAAYTELHRLGHAVSIECWQGERLVGGVYGISLGRVFFGESMFSLVSNASKVALVHLCDLGYELVDCQIPSAHLTSLGAVSIARQAFLTLLETWCDVALATPGPLRTADAVQTH